MILQNAQKIAQNLAKSGHTAYFLFSLITYEGLNKMQNYNTPSANHAQNFQNQKSGVTFVILFSLALFLAYAVNNHLVTDVFSYFMALLFDSFSIKNGSITADIVLLIAFLLMLFGLFCLIKFFLPLALTALIIAVVAYVFLAPDTVTSHESKAKAAVSSTVWGG